MRGPTCSFVSVLWPVYTAKSPGVSLKFFYLLSKALMFPFVFSRNQFSVYFVTLRSANENTLM